MVQSEYFQTKPQGKMPLVIEGVMSSRSRNLMADLTLLRKEKLATDTRILVVDNKGVASDPILVHSLVLAAASPVLASVLASSGESSEGFTIILPGMERGMVEREMDRLYDGDLDLDLLTHLGLLMDVKEEAKENKETGKMPKDSVPGRKSSGRNKKVVNYSQEYDLEDSDDFPLEDHGGQEDIDYESEYFGAVSLKDDVNEEDVKHSAEADIPEMLKCPHEDCKWKNVTFSSKPGLKRHLNRIHNIAPDGISGEDEGAYKSVERGNKFKCPHCRRAFLKKERVDAHIQRDHIKSTCESCGKVFSSGSLLAAHIERRHSAKKFHCDQ